MRINAPLCSSLFAPDQTAIMCSATVQMWVGWQDFKRFLVSAFIKESSLFLECNHTNSIMLFAQGTFWKGCAESEGLVSSMSLAAGLACRVVKLALTFPLLTLLPESPPSFLDLHLNTVSTLTPSLHLTLMTDPIRNYLFEYIPGWYQWYVFCCCFFYSMCVYICGL